MDRERLKKLCAAGGLLAAWALLTGCNAPLPAPAPTANPTGTPVPPAPTATSLPPDTPTPRPTPLPEDLVWFGPNMGSLDFPDLFDRPGEWTEARSRVDIFKFYIQNVLDIECDICGDNTLPAFERANAFRQLEAWSIGTAVEAGVVKEWGCRGNQAFRNVDLAIRNIAANGGDLDVIVMDEPRLGGEHEIDGRTCGMTVPQMATGVANFYDQMEAAHPDVIIGDIEPYPPYSVEELQAWLEALDAAGVTPAFFHLDVDIYRARVESQNVAGDLQRLRTITQERGIDFGVIFISSWRQAYNDRVYYDSTMDWIQQVNAAIGRPQHVIFQSWQGPAPSGAHEIPSNLPPSEGEDFSHTRLILDGLAAIGR